MAAPTSPRPTVGQVLRSSSTEYTIVDFVGEGSSGYVTKCQVNSTSELVAVKILKNTCLPHLEKELSVLSRISELDPDHFNLVKFYERFEYSSYTCLVFELLRIDLFQYLKTELCTTMCVNQIRPIAKQMLVALQGLKSLQVMHTDIKPDNIMLAINEEDIIQVKLIDFGLACSSSSAVCGKVLQPIRFRAPEVYLGLPCTEAIDMWGLGCTLAYLYLKAKLFPSKCQYLMMKSMVECLGMPSDHQLRLGIYTENFFCQEEIDFGFSWRLLTAEEYSECNGVKVKNWPRNRPHFSSLDDLLHIQMYEDAEEVHDRRTFIDFLKQLLTMDARKRFSPTEALQHPFITMTHLSQGSEDGGYLAKAQEFMATTGSPRGHSMKEVETHVDDQRHEEVPVTPASSQIIETDIPKVPHCDVNNDNESIQEPCHSSPVDSRIRSLSFPKRFISIIRKTFCGCWCPSVEE